MLVTLVASTGLLLQPATNFFAPTSVVSSDAVAMSGANLVDDFSVSRIVKDVRVFDGDYALEIVQTVEEVAKSSIDDKDSFSLAVPGGSVVAALAKFEGTDAFDFSKMHVFFCNEKIPSKPCLEGALEVMRKIGVPDNQVHGIGEGTPAEIAASYTELLKTHPSIDNSGAMPSFDMMLLGTGPDGHCGCIFPDGAEVKQTGSGAVVFAGNDDRADGDFVAVSIDTMNAAKVVIVSAAGAGRAPMVAKALSGNFGPYDCPAGMVEAAEDTLWFTDTEGIAEFDSADESDDEEGE
jgi:6-phosphogluconolactonase